MPPHLLPELCHSSRKFFISSFLPVLLTFAVTIILTPYWSNGVQKLKITSQCTLSLIPFKKQVLMIHSLYSASDYKTRSDSSGVERVDSRSALPGAAALEGQEHRKIHLPVGSQERGSIHFLQIMFREHG